LLSLPERVIRSALGLSAGLLREVGEVVLPSGVRRSQLYKSLVDTTLRYVIENVGGAAGVYPAAQPQPDDFLARKGAGHAIELLGLVAAIRSEVHRARPLALPSPDMIGNQWEALKQESTRQGRSVFETSSLMALSAVRAMPHKVRWLSASARVGARHAGKLLAAEILEQYSQTLSELREVGYLNYAKRQLNPYLHACVDQFSRQRPTLTQRLLEKHRKH